MEALRGLASVSVFIWHLSIAFAPSVSGIYSHEGGLIGTPFFFFMNGKAAVTFFFTLSGFVLTHKYFLTRDIHLISTGITKRYFRLALPVLIVVLASWFLFHFSFYHFSEAGALTNSSWLSNFGNAAFPENFQPTIGSAFSQGIYFAFFRGDNFYDTNLWTMNVELIGSIIVFLLAPLVIVMTRRNLIILIGILVVYYNVGLQSYICFLTGMLLAFLSAKQQLPKLNIYWKIFLILISLFLFSYTEPVGTYRFMNFDPVICSAAALTIYWHAIASLLLILVFISDGQPAKIFSGKSGAWLGSISFPLYLCHILVICSFSSWFLVWANNYSGNLYQAKLLTILVTLPAILIPVLLLRWIDKKWVRSLNQFFSRSQ